MCFYRAFRSPTSFKSTHRSGKLSGVCGARMSGRTVESTVEAAVTRAVPSKSTRPRRHGYAGTGWVERRTHWAAGWVVLTHSSRAWRYVTAGRAGPVTQVLHCTQEGAIRRERR
ncbi:hypothetical protein E2C01_040787 [Portunus trituberculatus]|uniref:Uncharacterized protein n=1 Tax=Portunus trituberculatus TaxID=210409 RepID=A0A5B7FPQ1_PORTR|nr:hypothetical protein [Portunus trituberculatus]